MTNKPKKPKRPQTVDDVLEHCRALLAEHFSSGAIVLTTHDPEQPRTIVIIGDQAEAFGTVDDCYENWQKYMGGSPDDD